MKYDKQIVNRICSLLESDSFTVVEVCKAVGIAERTFYTWREENADFAAKVKQARDHFDEKLAQSAKNSLAKLVAGFSVEETRTVYEPSDRRAANAKPRIKEQVVTKKHFAPNTAAVIFTLTNRDPENWKQRQQTDMNIEGVRPLRIEVKDDETKQLIEGLIEE